MSLAERLIDCTSNQRKFIVVAGDVMIDRWVHGHLDDSQDGCHKFVQRSACETVGGAGNAVRSLENWNVHTELYGHWNRGTKTRFVDELGSTSFIAFRHDCDVIAGPEYNNDRGYCLNCVEQADGVLLCDYDKGFLTPQLILKIAERCRRRGIPCVADVKRDPSLYSGCITKANEEWYLKYGIASVVTRGQCLPSVRGTVVGNHLSAVKCVNHVGAGDCFSAHLVLALAHQFSLEDAAVVAHSAGRVYVQHPHNRPPFPQEVAADMCNVVFKIGRAHV